MEKYKIFIVEDDKWYADLLEYVLLLNPEYEVEKYMTGREVLQNLYKKPMAITLDYRLGDLYGSEVLEKIKSKYPEIPVVIISSQDEIDVAVKLLKEGAYDYIIKNEETRDRLWNTMLNIRELHILRKENEELRLEVKQKFTAGKTILGESPQIKEVFKLIEKVADSNITVSISGETGTGKEMVARAIHAQSPRANRPMVSVNVSAIPEGLIESELFGHEKGAFTGAISTKTGKFEQAHKSSIFLDEIAEMSLAAQTKILRVLQEKEINRVGGEKTIRIDARLIVATNKNLATEVEKGNFRQDLYYRLMGVPIKMPPLRERGRDIIILAESFLKEFCKENNRNVPKFTQSAINKLLNYSFPGNVRELKAIVELSTILSEENQIEENHILFSKQANVLLSDSEELTLEEYDYRVIRHFMEKFNNRAILVARKLNISKSTIYRMLKKMNYEF